MGVNRSGGHPLASRESRTTVQRALRPQVPWVQSKRACLRRRRSHYGEEFRRGIVLMHLRNESCGCASKSIIWPARLPRLMCGVWVTPAQQQASQ